MASKNKNQSKVKSEAQTRKKVADYVLAFFAIILIISLVLSAFVTY